MARPGFGDYREMSPADSDFLLSQLSEFPSKEFDHFLKNVLIGDDDDTEFMNVLKFNEQEQSYEKNRKKALDYIKKRTLMTFIPESGDPDFQNAYYGEFMKYGRQNALQNKFEKNDDMDSIISRDEVAEQNYTLGYKQAVKEQAEKIIYTIPDLLPLSQPQMQPLLRDQTLIPPSRARKINPVRAPPPTYEQATAPTCPPLMMYVYKGVKVDEPCVVLTTAHRGCTKNPPHITRLVTYGLTVRGNEPIAGENTGIEFFDYMNENALEIARIKEEIQVMSSINKSNSCWMNSTIHSLLSIPIMGHILVAAYLHYESTLYLHQYVIDDHSHAQIMIYKLIKSIIERRDIDAYEDKRVSRYTMDQFNEDMQVNDATVLLRHILSYVSKLCENNIIDDIFLKKNEISFPKTHPQRKESKSFYCDHLTADGSTESVHELINKEDYDRICTNTQYVNGHELQVIEMKTFQTHYDVLPEVLIVEESGLKIEPLIKINPHLITKRNFNSLIFKGVVYELSSVVVPAVSVSVAEIKKQNPTLTDRQIEGIINKKAAYHYFAWCKVTEENGDHTWQRVDDTFGGTLRQNDITRDLSKDIKPRISIYTRIGLDPRSKHQKLPIHLRYDSDKEEEKSEEYDNETNVTRFMIINNVPEHIKRDISKFRQNVGDESLKLGISNAKRINQYASDEYAPTSTLHQNYLQFHREHLDMAIRRVRGDNYCALRAVLYVSLINTPENIHNRLTAVPTPYDYFLANAETNDDVFDLTEWKFANLNTEHQPTTTMVLDYLCQCFDYLKEICKTVSSMKKNNEDYKTYVQITFRDKNEVPQILLMEAIKYIMYYNLIELEKQQTAKPTWLKGIHRAEEKENSDIVKSRHNRSPRRIDRFNVIGDTGGLYEEYNFLLAYSLDITIHMFIMQIPGQIFESKFNEEASDASKNNDVYVITNNGQHINVLETI